MLECSFELHKETLENLNIAVKEKHWKQQWEETAGRAEVKAWEPEAISGMSEPQFISNMELQEIHLKNKDFTRASSRNMKRDW